MIICSEMGNSATSETECISSVLLICGGGVRSILLLLLVAVGMFVVWCFNLGVLKYIVCCVRGIMVLCFLFVL